MIFQSANLQEMLLRIDNSELCLVDFYATWCSPCKRISEIIEELSKDYPQITIVKFDIADDPEVSKHFGVRSVPVLMFFRDGLMWKNILGAKRKDDLIKIFNDFIDLEK
jgi:thioredoxin 1